MIPHFNRRAAHRPAPIRFVARLAAVSGLALVLAGCSGLPDWLGSSDGPRLPGERISILSLEHALEPDPGLADVQVRLPRPYANESWPQAGGAPSHAMHHLALGEDLKVLWRVQAGAGVGSETRQTAQPVVAGGRVFVMDPDSRVSAFGAADGELIWRRDLTPEDEERGTIGGGIAYYDGRIYAGTAYGEVFSIDAATGEFVWKESIRVPMRAAPSVYGGRVFVVTYDNQLHSLKAEDGSSDWVYEGLSETAGLIGAASPAVEGDLIVAPFSSGEIVGLRTSNGHALWSDVLSRVGRFSALSTITDINGRPVIDRGLVIASSYSGRTVAIDLRSGERIWDQDIASLQDPWVVGNYVYLVTPEAEVVCLARENGRIRWVRQLPRYENEEKKTDPIVWAGPVLGGDRLVLTSSNGVAISVSPYDGEIMGRIELSDAASVPPVIANGVLYILTDDGELVAMR